MTRNFRDTVQSRINLSPKFRRGILREAIECLLSGELDTGRAMLRDYINGTSRSRRTPLGFVRSQTD